MVCPLLQEKSVIIIRGTKAALTGISMFEIAVSMALRDAILIFNGDIERNAEEFQRVDALFPVRMNARVSASRHRLREPDVDEREKMRKIGATYPKCPGTRAASMDFASLSGMLPLTNFKIQSEHERNKKSRVCW